jgi:CBS domain-containing protein
MSHFELPVELFMTEFVHCVALEDDVNTANELLEGLSISSLAVVEDVSAEKPKLAGVISRTDLIRIGRRDAGSRGKSALLTLPQRQVADVMSSDVVTVSPQDSIAFAAGKMVEGRFHRVYVEEDGELIGILSTRDIMLAIRDKRGNQPLHQWMSSPVFTIRVEEPISLATERLEKAHVSGLLAVEDGWPVGIFTQREALEARDQPRDTPVDEVMSSAMLVLDADTLLHRAAHQAAELRVRRVIAIRNRKLEGILTGFDFARAAM